VPPVRACVRADQSDRIDATGCGAARGWWPGGVDMGVVMATDRSGPLLLSEAKGRIGARPGVRV
jgi:hypothetical protein